jgi:hypothetical protein
VYPKRVAEFALATAILVLSAAVCIAAKEAAARLEDGQVRSRQELSDGPLRTAMPGAQNRDPCILLQCIRRTWGLWDCAARND